MKHKYGYIFKELPIQQIERDPDQPRKDFGTGGDENRLLVSIKEYGIEQPIAVSEIEKDRYVIMDGHRRYICAQKLQFETIFCRVYPRLNTGELESRRYEMQNNRRAWRPMERSDALERIKLANGFKTNRELANHLGMSETLAAVFIQLRKQKMVYLELMERYDLAECYRIEFLRIKPKLRRIRDYEVDDIVVNIFERIKHRVMRSSEELHLLGRIFLRATANEAEIYNYLSNQDMTIQELVLNTTQSGFSLLIEQLIQRIGKKKQEGIPFTEQEQLFLDQLRTLLNKAV